MASNDHFASSTVLVPTVFVSYSHKDEVEKDALLKHLNILERIGLVDVWNDDQIGAGEAWEDKINQAIERADVAILLISANFLTSDFILNKEVPKLLDRRQREGLIIFPIISTACAWKSVEWLTKINVRPKNGKPVWGEGRQIDQDLAAIAQEVAHIVKTFSAKPKPESSPSPSPAQSTPIIQNPKQLSLPPEAGSILKTLFGDCQRVTIIDEFGAGLSGSRIFMVRPIINDATAHLRTVVKLATVSMIEKEWQAYQSCIRNRLPDAAQIQGQPALSSSGEWGGLRYALQGSGGTFEIESLASYLRRADVEDARFVFKRLFKRLDQVLQQASPHFEFQMRAGYDRVLPVNLLVEPTTHIEVNLRSLTPTQLPDRPLKQGDLVQLSGFEITKVDPIYKSVTLICPASDLPSSYCLRLKPIEAIGTDRLGQIIDPIAGVVTETRQEKLEDEVRRALGRDFDLTQETVSWPGGPSLPNPLIKWPNLLQESRDVKVACIHGDLNLENILVDPETRDVGLIDFADARRDHVLHDFLRLETEVVTKIIPEILQQHNLPVGTIYTFYQHLHTAIAHPGQVTASPNPVLEKPWVILLAVREMAKGYLLKRSDWTEYYQGLVFYLLGALRFKNLDVMDEAPTSLPKQVAFWGAATVVLNKPSDVVIIPKAISEEQRRIDAAIPGQAEVGQQINLFIQVRFPDSPPLSIQDWPIKQKPSSIEQVTESITLSYSINPQTGKPKPVRLEIRVTAPNFVIEGKARQFIEIFPKEYSKKVSFLLTPLNTGNNQINVEVYDSDGTFQGVIPVETTVGGLSMVPNAIVANLLFVVKVVKHVATVVGAVESIEFTGSPPSGGEQGALEKETDYNSERTNMSQQSLQYLRECLVNSFVSPDEARTFCFDYLREVFHDLTHNDSQSEIVRKMVIHCDAHDDLDLLYNFLANERPNRYKRCYQRYGEQFDYKNRLHKG